MNVIVAIGHAVVGLCSLVVLTVFALTCWLFLLIVRDAAAQWSKNRREKTEIAHAIDDIIRESQHA